MVMEPNSPTNNQLDYRRRLKLAAEDCKYLRGWVPCGFDDVYSLECELDDYERECKGKCSKYEFQLPEDGEREELMVGIGILAIIIIILGIIIILMNL